MKSRMVSRSLKFLLCFSVFALLFNPFYLFHENSIGDDASYIAHTYTMAYDGDLDYCNEIAFDSAGCALQKGRTSPPHPAGIGLLNMPLVGAFALIDKANHHSVVDDRSQYIGSFGFLAMFFSVNFFFLFGLWLYKKAIQSLVDGLPSWFILLLLGSYGILFYTLQRFTMNHVHGFFLGALMFWLAVRLIISQRRKELITVSFLIPFVASFCYLLRPVNLLTIFFPFIIISIIVGKEFFQQRLKFYLPYILLGFVVAITFACTFNYHIYGVFFPNSTEIYGYEIERIPKGFINKVQTLFQELPDIRLIFFSSEFGLWLTSPVLCVGLFLLFYQLVVSKSPHKWVLFLLTLIIIAVPFSVVLLWQTVASSYGYRYLFILVPLAVLGFVWFFQTSQARYQKLLKKVTLPLLCFGILGQVFFMTIPDLSSRNQMNVFGRQDLYSVKGYHLSLVESLVNPQAWKNLMAKRLPGFLYILTADELTIQQRIDKGNEQYRKVKIYQQQIKKAGTPYVLLILLYSIIFPYLISRFLKQ